LRRDEIEEESDTDVELGVQALMGHGYATGGLEEYEEVVDTWGEIFPLPSPLFIQWTSPVSAIRLCQR